MSIMLFFFLRLPEELSGNFNYDHNSRTQWSKAMHAWHRNLYPFESLFVRREVYRFLSNFSKLSPCSGCGTVCTIIPVCRRPLPVLRASSRSFQSQLPHLSCAPDLLRNSFGNFPIFISARYYIKNSKLAPLSPREFSLSVIKDSQPLTISARRRSFLATSPFLDIHLLQSIP